MKLFLLELTDGDTFAINPNCVLYITRSIHGSNVKLTTGQVLTSKTQPYKVIEDWQMAINSKDR